MVPITLPGNVATTVDRLAGVGAVVASVTGPALDTGLCGGK